MMREKMTYGKIDWVMIICYLLLVCFGWLNIYASSVTGDDLGSFTLASRAGNQLIWIGISLLVAVLILTVIDVQIYSAMKWLFYIAVVGMLMAVLVFGSEVNGSRSWLRIGGFALQPAEFSKITTALALAFTMNRYNFSLTNGRDALQTAAIMGLPAALILLEPEVGTLMVYFGLIFMLFREGFSGKIIAFIGILALLFIVGLVYSPLVSMLIVIGIFGVIHGFQARRPFLYILYYGAFITLASFIPRLLAIEQIAAVNPLAPEVWLLIIIAPVIVTITVLSIRKKRRDMTFLVAAVLIAIAVIFSVDFIYNDVLMPHHRDRIESTLGITKDLSGAGYNVHQSQIAIGSGGLSGKGFLQGTQTKFNFIPEQSTDFIFCTVGEEWGFLGCIFVIAVFFTLIYRILMSAEKQRERSYRIFGYCVASYLFMHVFINIGMTIGIMPVVGIPLPLISYGGSSLLTFTILIFIYIRFDMERKMY